MKKFVGVLTAGVLAILVPLTAAAQSRPLGVGGTVDYTRMTEDESFLGSGIGFAGGVQWHLTPATAVEFEVGRERHVRDLGLHAVITDAQGRIDAVPVTIRWEGNATFVLASLSHAFGSGVVRPVVWGGAGLMHDDGTRRGPTSMPAVPAGYTLQPGDMSSHQSPSATVAAIDSGVGFDTRVASRVDVRPFAGLRLAATGNSGPKYIIRFGVRVAFRP